jgi:outer membrane protein assembly factor BamA
MRRAAIVVLGLLALGGCRHTPPNVAVENPVVVEDVRLEGFDVLPIGAREDLAGDFPLRSGTGLTGEIEQVAGDRAVEILQNHGYPYGQVSIAREPLGAGRARVIVRAQPGTLGYFGRIDIAGNRRVDDEVIRRRLSYAPGDLFRRSAIERTQQRIGTIGLFKSVEIRALDIDAQPAEVPTLITVEERSPWQWNLSLGYAAGEQVSLGARISHLNVLGAARRIDLQGRVSRIELAEEIAFTQAEAWHPSLSLSLQGRNQTIDERSFFVMSRGGQASVRWQWTRAFATTFSYAAALERSNVSENLDVLLGLQDGMLNAWSVDLDDRRAAAGRDGGQLETSFDAPPPQTLSVHVEQAGRWMPGTFNYLNVIGDLRRYRRVLDDRVVFASRLRYGAIDPAGTEADIPLLKRFFLGGSSEMRGWGIYELSPLSASGEPVGGKSMVTATGEVRFSIVPRLTAAFFVEAGNVWQDSWAMHLDDLVYDLGPGLRVDTPFGRLRIDFGYQLKQLDGLRIEGQPQKHRWRINFGIGEAF